MQRKFIGNLFILQALNWLIKPLWIFWIDRLAQVQLGDEWYGKYYVVFSFGLLFNILLDFGLNNYVAATVGKTQNPENAKSALKLRIGLAIGYVFLVLALGIWQQFDRGILLLAVANQVLAGFVLFFRSVLQGMHRFRRDSLVSVTDRLVAILLCAILLYSQDFNGKSGVLVFLGAQTVGYAVALIFVIWSAFGHKKVQTESPVNESLQLVLRNSLWFAILAFAMSVFTRIDALMIKNLATGSYAEAGLYAQSFRLLDAALIFSSLISTMLLPLFSRMIAQKENTDSLVWLNFRIVLFVALPAALAAHFFGGDILYLLYKKTYSGDGEFLRSQAVFFPLMTCFIPMALVHIFGTWLTAANKVKYLAFVAIASMLLNIAINYLCIPNYGAEGAAWACLITQSLFAAGCMIQSYRLKAFQNQWIRIALLLIWILVSILIFWQFSIYFHGITGFLAAISAFIIATVFSGIFFPEIKKVLYK